MGRSSSATWRCVTFQSGSPWFARGGQPEALKSTQDERVTMRTVSNFLEQSVIVRNAEVRALSHGHVAACVGSTMFRVSRE